MTPAFSCYAVCARGPDGEVRTPNHGGNCGLQAEADGYHWLGFSLSMHQIDTKSFFNPGPHPGCSDRSREEERYGDLSGSWCLGLDAKPSWTAIITL